MNYYEIGQRIRQYRRRAGLSQEQLAEAANISVTHMSHIETGNTKLSLPVLADIAATLNVSCDRLIKSAPTANADYLMGLLADCTPAQLDMIAAIAAIIKKGNNGENK